MAARAILLSMAALSLLAALAGADAAWPPTALRVGVAAVMVLLAPLFWPGAATARLDTAARVLGWSLTVAALAALAMRTLGGEPQGPAPVLGVLSVLLPMLVVLHAAAALIEQRLSQAGGGPEVARETAARAVVLALGTLAALPLFLGPAAELLSVRSGSAVDWVVVASPLTHLAVASGNDLLHNAWLYDHSNLSALALSYPEAMPVTLGYAAAAAAALAVLAAPRLRATTTPSIELETEKRP